MRYLVGGLTVNELHVGSSLTLPAIHDSPEAGSEFKGVRARWVVRRQTVNLVPPGKHWGFENLGTHQLQVRSSSGQNTWLLTRPMPDRGRPDLPTAEEQDGLNF